MPTVAGQHTLITLDDAVARILPADLSAVGEAWVSDCQETERLPYLGSGPQAKALERWSKIGILNLTRFMPSNFTSLLPGVVFGYCTASYSSAKRPNAIA